MPDENQPDDLIYNNIRMYTETNPPTSYSGEPSFEQKCLQSLLNLRIKAKIDNNQVIICMKCWKNWYFNCQECPLCRSKEPLELVLKTLNSGTSDKIHELNHALSLVEAYERECKHPFCGNCCLDIGNDGRMNCVFCYSEVRSGQDDLDLRAETYCRQPAMKRCVDCLRRWMVGIKMCPFCLRLSNDLAESNKPASAISNRDENHELESLVDTFTNRPTASINSGIFGGSNSSNQNSFTIDASLSNNYGFISNENVSNMTTNETRRTSGEFEAALNRHISMLTELYTKRFTDMMDDVERSFRSRQNVDKDRSRSNSRSNNSSSDQDDQDDQDDQVSILSSTRNNLRKGSGNTSSRKSRR